MTDNNIVLIGKKHTMSYVLATVTQFNNGEEEVLIKARGKAINKAVDVAEIVRNRFYQGSLINGISVMTENLKSLSGDMVNVSAIEIRMGKGEGKLTADIGRPARGRGRKDAHPAKGGDKPDDPPAKGGDKPDDPPAKGGDKPDDPPAKDGDKPDDPPAK